MLDDNGDQSLWASGTPAFVVERWMATPSLTLSDSPGVLLDFHDTLRISTETPNRMAFK